MAGPREWSPRKNSFPNVIRKIIHEMKDSGQSEAIQMAELLQSAMFEEQDNFSYGFAEAILDQFEEWAQYAKKELKKHSSKWGT